MANEAAITTYGEINASAPDELKVFSFIVGKWAGTGKTRLEDGKHAQFQLTWIGRYILNGMAIADEFHSSMPDGAPYLGISLRHFDTKQGAWIIEYLNVTNSFLRRQVNPKSGAVSQAGDTVVVVSEDGDTRIREHYRVESPNRFTYSTDMSQDGGKTWDAPMLEMTLTRAT